MFKDTIKYFSDLSDKENSRETPVLLLAFSSYYFFSVHLNLTGVVLLLIKLPCLPHKVCSPLSYMQSSDLSKQIQLLNYRS